MTDEIVDDTPDHETADEPGSPDHGDVVFVGDDTPGEEPSDDSGDGDVADAEYDEEWDRPRPSVGFALLRVVVVLVVAAVGYQLVVPQTHTVNHKLSDLVTSKTGVKDYSGPAKNSGSQQPSSFNIPALTAAAKASPAQTGVYSEGWDPSQSEAAAVLVFLMPDAGQAATLTDQIVPRFLAAKATEYASSGLTRSSTFTVASLPGSQGSIFDAPKSVVSSGANLAVVVDRVGRVVALTQVVQTTGAQAPASTVAEAEHAQLVAVESSFSKKVVTHPLVATLLWVIGSVLIALLVGFGPFALAGLRDRRDRRYQEELDRQVVVGGTVITKRRV